MLSRKPRSCAQCARTARTLRAVARTLRAVERTLRAVERTLRVVSRARCALCRTHAARYVARTLRAVSHTRCALCSEHAALSPRATRASDALSPRATRSGCPCLLGRSRPQGGQTMSRHQNHVATPILPNRVATSKTVSRDHLSP